MLSLKSKQSNPDDVVIDNDIRVFHRGTLLWILRARDRDRDILARLRFGHQRPLNRRCPARLGHQRPVNRGCPRVSKPVSQDISVNLLLFTYWYFSSGHLRFSGRWCPNLNLAKISLSLSRLKTTHTLFCQIWQFCVY